MERSIQNADDAINRKDETGLETYFADDIVVIPEGNPTLRNKEGRHKPLC